MRRQARQRQRQRIEWIIDMYKYACVYTCAYVEQNVCIETVKSDSKDWKENNEQREQNIQLEDTSMQIRITAMQQTTRPLCKENS